MSNLTIWLPQDLRGPWPWHEGQSSGIASTPAEKAMLGSRSSKDSLVVIPGQWVRVFSHDLPKMRQREQLSAAKFSVEDKLAAPLEEQHCVLGAGDDQRLAVIAHDKMDAITQVLSQAGLGAARICADFDVLKSQSQPLHLADRIIVPGPIGHSLDPAMAEFANIQSSEDISLSRVSAMIDAGSALDLRGGSYAARGAGFGGFSAASLKRSAVLLAVLLGSYGLWEASKLRATKAHSADLKAQSRALYTQATGKAAPANPARAVTRALSGATGDEADFLLLSSSLFKAMETVDGVMIDSLQFDVSRGQLNLRLIYPSFEAATALEDAAKAQGLTFNPGGVREQAGQRIGDAVVRGGP